ncbi:Glycosyl_hydrolase family 25 protein [Hexamita inflata]|uniref:Glycosyl hydrolase family 25 protein n=1 Tax=Hexamita inflata TaxID=28002 RepID=A0AA86N7E3_9EUKA|nr:Glycosyl hydrolase family 25 protein [Hexamita inflata]
MPTQVLDPTEQINAVMKKLLDGNVIDNQTKIWLDAEDTQNYFGYHQENQNFINEMIQVLINILGADRVGIYTSLNSWSKIVDYSWRGVTSQKLWYVKNDGKQNFYDFASFGGWTRPFIKEYSSEQNLCGLQLNKDFESGK